MMLPSPTCSLPLDVIITQKASEPCHAELIARKFNELRNVPGRSFTTRNKSSRGSASKQLSVLTNPRPTMPPSSVKYVKGHNSVEKMPKITLMSRKSSTTGKKKTPSSRHSDSSEKTSPPAESSAALKEPDPPESSRSLLKRDMAPLRQPLLLKTIEEQQESESLEDIMVDSKQKKSGKRKGAGGKRRSKSSSTKSKAPVVKAVKPCGEVARQAPSTPALIRRQTSKIGDSLRLTRPKEQQLYPTLNSGHNIWMRIVKEMSYCNDGVDCQRPRMPCRRVMNKHKVRASKQVQNLNDEKDALTDLSNEAYGKPEGEADPGSSSAGGAASNPRYPAVTETTRLASLAAFLAECSLGSSLFEEKSLRNPAPVENKREMTLLNDFRSKGGTSMTKCSVPGDGDSMDAMASVQVQAEAPTCQDKSGATSKGQTKPKTYEALGLAPLTRSPSSENHFPIVLKVISQLERTKKKQSGIQRSKSNTMGSGSTTKTRSSVKQTDSIIKTAMDSTEPEGE